MVASPHPALKGNCGPGRSGTEQ